MMLLLLLYINVSLMLIHESTQLKHPREEIIRIKDNIRNIRDGLKSWIRITRTAKQNMQAQADKMKSHLKNQNRSIDEFTDCAKINIRSIRGNDFTREMSIFMNNKTVHGTKYYNETIETWNNCFSKMKSKFHEDIDNHRMKKCDGLINRKLHGLGLLRKFIIDYYDNNLQYNMWLFIHEALKNIVEEHENSGVL
uniref:Plasmodium RESA N-terminal domain-containing protein n=1 Tax=Schistosoma japonicum TaxID=6182 RepID=C1LL94_SCHJA|nr:hypothetical protein [Schistosoma japonicum]